MATYLAPAVLLIVVIVQWIAAATVPISPWIGGGFGMFATVDGDDRVVTVEGEAVRTAAAVEHAAAPTARSAERLRAELDTPGPIIVWRPVYEPATGHLTFEPIAESDGR